MTSRESTVPIESVSIGCYTIPTDKPESDGTLEWQSTTLVLCGIEAGGVHGLGYGYADTATARLIQDRFAPLLQGRDALATSERWRDLAVAVRNLGRPGIGAMALSVVDTALWDFKAKYLGVSLAVLLGKARPSIPIYGSGGFTSYSIPELQDQLGAWARAGIGRVKMKVGREPDLDIKRVGAAAGAIGRYTQLFVDANGAYERKQALHFAEAFAELGVAWFEEPVSSDDLAGLRLLRDRGPAGMAISAGEYGYDLPYFRRMLEAQAVDILQADATRCGGITGFLGAAALCEAFNVPLSSHCAPALHVPLCCAARPAVHLEYFHDHVRIEQLLFDGAPQPADGRLAPAYDRPGLGLEFKEQDAQCFRNS
ncbi:MAG TPA: enolase C-terminal domain-like protein [Rhodocyclaceae bacterium]|nr:enolase C-terminal domain-like protein [Rhodocyclaceae bacterium]